MPQVEWMFRVQVTLGVECLKKQQTVNDPYKSNAILTFLKQHGKFKAVVSYMEYLTIQCKLKEKKFHTELACLYIDGIN